MRKMRRTAAGLLAVILFLSGCGANPVEGTSEEKSLTVALGARPATMDAQMANDVTSHCCLRLVTESLYRIDDEGEAVPAMATGYTMSPDGLTYTISLRDDLRFSDGEPIVAEDYVFAFRRIADPEEASDSIRLIADSCVVKNAVAVNAGELPLERLGVQAPDDRTLVVELEKPCPDIAYILAEDAISPCRERFYNSCGGHFASSPETMLSSGPFYVDRYQPLGTQIHFKKNPYFYDSDQIRLEEITFQCVSDPQQANMCYQTGLVDMTEVKGEFITLSEGDESLQKNTSGSFDFVVVNQRSEKEACRNVNFRHALANCINREEICEKLEYGAASPLTRTYPAGSLKDENGEDAASDPEFYKELCAYDENAAKAFYEQATKELGVSSLELKMIVSQARTKMAEVIKDEWERVLPGLKVNIRTMQPAQFYEEMMGDEYDVCILGMTIDAFDPTSVLAIHKSDNPMNVPGYNNPELDKKVDEIYVEMDKRKRTQLALEVEKILMNDMPIIPIYSIGSSWLAADTVKNFRAPGDGIIDVSRVWKESR